jgi:hypothetical protein
MAKPNRHPLKKASPAAATQAALTAAEAERAVQHLRPFGVVEASLQLCKCWLYNHIMLPMAIRGPACARGQRMR